MRRLEQKESKCWHRKVKHKNGWSKRKTNLKRNEIKLEQKRDKSFLAVERKKIKLEEKGDSVVLL